MLTPPRTPTELPRSMRAVRLPTDWS